MRSIFWPPPSHHYAVRAGKAVKLAGHVADHSTIVVPLPDIREAYD